MVLIKDKIVLTLLAISFFVISKAVVNAATINIPTGSGSGYKLNIKTSNLSVTGDINNAALLQATTGTITLGGNWNNSGSFLSGTGIVNLNSIANAQSVVTGGTSSAFYSLNINNTNSAGVLFNDTLYCTSLNAQNPGGGVNKLTFSNTGIHTISSFNVNGSPGQLIALASSSAGTAWNINTPSTTVNYVNVSDSHEAAGNLITALYSIDGGNNVNWQISNTGTINHKPIANAGPDQSKFVTEIVILNGSASTDLDGDALTYQWLLRVCEIITFTTLS